MILYYIGYWTYLGVRWLWRRVSPSYIITYQWYLDGNPIPGAVGSTSPSFHPDDIGRVTLRTTYTRL